MQLPATLAICAALTQPVCALTSKTLDLRTTRSKSSYYVVLASRGGADRSA